MWLVFLIYQFVLILQCEAQNACLTHPTFREPDNSDITVVCGTNKMDLQILLCPIYFIGYNESTMALNGQFARPECIGTPDWTVDPPVLKFQFLITETAISTCSNKLTIVEEVGSGLFSDFSNVQSVNISGMVNSQELSAGTITYRQEMVYLFSCSYPLQYLVNNTQMSVSGVSLAIKDNNGSFISTLSMMLFEDMTYTSPLSVPPTGLMLKTRVFVEVRATNLTHRFNVLLDRCFATTSPYLVSNSTTFEFFVGCNHDPQTIIGVNGEQQVARFSFETFRFVEHRNRSVSTYYVHCTTRLCETSFCTALKQNCTSRKRRAVESAQETTVSDYATVTSGPLMTKVDNVPNTPIVTVYENSKHNNAVVGVSVAAGVFGLVSLAMLSVLLYKIHSERFKMDKPSLFR
ncbi:zona pellucida-like domain-containing protein 1 [Misgurnus anguillicaudatus]|uniref:zona pellucida-like domain-containing protein 1 n=1 Tax=Misgurnus anguillicaudatus TaxID=75329 RepID=UPI002435AD6A|nr:zona pellucida-like domain-containing protein 1 [Misgurnus anguillicaudatus]